ncbi:hypothetical protein [Tsukamurella paurometabola]|uniref:Lsr2 n=1 Tax=Tsukamurella paurometabola TaxID=2061 RepID=A0ABS5NKE0_TSUPA|nr:hypothetical protein [Tsukamurella paurometabola]MBS4103883.1 hypothetical protein [Tsukamurella paurometabola]
MNGPTPGYSPRRAGEVVGVEITPRSPRPVTITCHDHAHRYELAYVQAEGGQVVTDLRITSDDGTPITAATLRRINPDRLARAAARHDTAKSAEAARDLRTSIDAATGTTEGHDWIERYRPTEAGMRAALAKHAPPGAAIPAPSQGGRPPLSREFLARVAQWARDAKAAGQTVYPYVAARGEAETGHSVSTETAKGWIARCKKADLLTADELRRPRRARTAARPTNSTSTEPETRA